MFTPEQMNTDLELTNATRRLGITRGPRDAALAIWGAVPASENIVQHTHAAIATPQCIVPTSFATHIRPHSLPRPMEIRAEKIRRFFVDRSGRSDISASCGWKDDFFGIFKGGGRFNVHPGV